MDPVGDRLNTGEVSAVRHRKGVAAELSGSIDLQNSKALAVQTSSFLLLVVRMLLVGMALCF